MTQFDSAAALGLYDVYRSASALRYVCGKARSTAFQNSLLFSRLLSHSVSLCRVLSLCGFSPAPVQVPCNYRRWSLLLLSLSP